MHDSNANGSVRKPANEVGSSIDWVDHPPRFTELKTQKNASNNLRDIISKNDCFAIGSSFFTNELVVWVFLTDFFQNSLFYQLVSRSD